MNKIYKVIWNAALQCWVAVSELGKAKGKTKSKKVLSAAAVMAVSAVGVSSNAEAAATVTTSQAKLLAGDNIVPIGKGTIAGLDGVAIGTNANASQLAGIAIGKDSKTSDTSGQPAIAIGANAQALGMGSISFGYNSQATGLNATAIGVDTQSNHAHTLAVGYGAKALNYYSSAIGSHAKALEQYTIAFGKGAEAQNYETIAMGAKALANGESSVAIGGGYTAEMSTGSLDDLNGARTKGNYAAAVGAGTVAAGSSTAVGTGAKADSTQSVAVGKDTKANQPQAVAVGESAKANSRETVAVGQNATAQGDGAIATGKNSKTEGTDAIATGRNSKALANNATAIGAGATATINAEGSLVIGRGAVVNATDATVVGPVAQANGANATAVGRGAAANGTESTALGRGATANGNQSIALGQGAQATVDSGVALGDGAVANRAARNRDSIVVNTADPSKTTGLSDNNNGGDANTVYAPVRLVDAPGALEAIKNTIKGNKGAVSVGDAGNTRQIINVAAGSADSDAVNVAQLKAVAGSIKRYFVTSPDGSITVTNPTPGTDPQNFQIKMNTTAVQDAAQWYVKEGTETSGTAVRGGNTVSFNDSPTVDVQHNNKNFSFHVKSGDVTTNTNTGAITGPTDGNVLAKAKNVAEAIQRSGWELQANGTKVGLVNPGDKVNIKAGTGVTITPTNEANGISTLTISAAQQNYSWKLKEDSQTPAQALNVTNNTAVSLKGENYLNITNRNGGNFAFKTVTADVGMNTATGATSQATATGLTTNKAVADAIQASGFQLKENGTLRNVVNPGESLNFKPGQGTTVSVGTNGDVQVNANVADIQAGNNVTVAKNNGVVTINAKDTQASVTRGNGVTLTETTNGNGTKNYQIGVDVDGTTVQIKNGKLTASAQQNYSWKLKEDSQTAAEALNVTNNTAVSLKGENYLNITNRNGGNFAFKTVTADVGMNTATGATSQATATGLTTNKAVADAIQASGFQLKENGTLRNVVNPGESLNFKPGQGTTVSVGANGDVQVNANVAGITEGKNISTTTDANGNVTINAKDTSAHVKAANNAAVKVDKATTTRTENNADITDYTVDLTDQTKTNITHGVNANETVTNKGLTFNGNTGSTGIKKLGSSVDVIGNTSNNVITTTANPNGITVDYNSTAAAQVTNLTYKANNANAKSVTLAKGLDFTNGTQTTAEVGDDGVVKFNVNTTALSSTATNGKITVPTGDGLVTAKEVANAINAANWKLNVNGDNKQSVSAGDIVNFADGNGTTVTYKDGAVRVNANVTDVVSANSNATITRDPNTGIVTVNAKDTNTQVTVANATNSPITIATTQNANGTNHYTVDVNVDDTTIKKENGVLKAVIPSVETVTLNVNTTGNNAGKVEAPTTDADKKKLVTAENVAKAINESYWVAKRGDSVTTNEDAGDGDSNVAAGNNVTFVAGKNMALQKAGNKFIYATKDDVSFNNVTANNTTTTNLTVNKGGNVDMGGNQVHNVSTGTAPTDAVNVKQLYDTVSGNVSTESVIKKAGDDNIAEVTVADNKQSGDKNAKYEVSVSKAKIKALANETVKVNTSTAANNPITVTPHTENGNTTYTVNFDGAKAASEIPLTYKANDGAGKTVKLSEGLNFKNGTQTTAEVGDNGVVKFNVNTTTLSNTTANGKITVPDGNGLVTAKEVANAINAANWKLNVNGDNKQSVSAGDIVNFADGNGTTVTYKDGAVRVNANVTDVVSANSNATITRDPNTGIVTVNAKDTNTQASVKNGSGITVTPSTNANGTANYTVAVNVDGSTITVNNDGKLVANVPDTSKVSLTNNAGKVGDVSAEDANKLVTGDNLAKTINATYWKASQGTHEETTSEETTGAVSSEIKPGDELTFVSGKNMALKKDGNKFVYATKDDVTFNNVTTNNLTVKNGGNVDMGGNQVHNVANGTKGTDAVNLDQLNATTATANAGWVIKANGTNATTVKPNATVSLNNTDGNILITKNTTNNNVTFNFNPNATFGVVGKDGKDGVDGSIGVNGKDGASVVINGKDGSIGLTGPKGADGKDGVSLTLKPEKGTTTVNEKDANKEIERIKYTANGTTREVATLDDGLKFAGDDNAVINRTLGSLLNITGGAEKATVADNIRVTNDGKNGLKVQLSNNVTFNANGSVKVGETTVNNGGLTITGGPSITKDGGVNAGDKVISNVSTGVKDNDAVNVKQLKDTVADSVSTESVIKKADEDNIAEVSPKAGQTLGDKNATYEVSVSKAKIKALANETVKVNTSTAANNPITVTPHTENGNTTYTVNFDGAKAASEIPLTYKANDGAGKTVKLSEGLNFKNGTQTTAEVGDNGVVKFNVNTTTLSNTTANGKITVPDGNGLVTAKDVANAINASYWKANAGGNVDGATVADNVTTGTEVFFAAGKNLKVKHSANNFTFSTADDVSFNNVTTNNLTVNAKGNVDMGGNQVHNVANGTKGTDAVNLDQLNATTAIANAGWVIKANGTNATTVKPNATVSLNNTDGNILITKNTTDNNVTFNFNPNATFGVSGKDGKDGSIGVNGKDGASVVINGKDGSIGLTGPKGADGKDGASANMSVQKGTTTVNTDRDGGKEVTRIVYTDKDKDGKDIKREVATLDDGLKFKGDSSQVINRTLGSQMNITGGADETTLTDNNIGVVYDKATDGLKVKLAKDVNLTTNGSVVIGNTTLNNNGFTITNKADPSKTVSVTDKGLNNGGNTIINVAPGVNGTDAVNLDQLNATTAIANAGWVIKANGTNATTVKPNATVSLNNTDGNIVITKNKTDNNVTFNFNPNATFGVKGKDGKDGVDGSIGVNGKDGSSVVINGKDGSIGLNGKDGKNGLSIKGDQGPAGVGGKDGETKTRIVYEYADPQDPNKTIRENVATLNDGLIFTGNNGVRNNHKLNTLVTIIGEGVDKAASANFTSASGNINVKADGKGTLEVQLAKNLKNIETINNGNSTITLNKDGGTTISGGDVSVAGNKVTNVKDGDVSANSKDAVNGSQLYHVMTNATAGWNLSVNNGKDKGNVKPGAQVDLNNTDGNIIISKNANNVTFNFNPNATFGVKGKDGKDGVDGSIGVNGKDGSSVVLNGRGGSIGLTGPKGADGKDGASANMSVQKGTTTVNTDRDGGKEVTRIVYTDKDKDGKDIKREVATLDDGLKFKGDSEQVINRTLGSQMNITGGADSTKLTDNNIGVVYDEATNGLKVKLSKDVDLGKDGSITIGGTQVTNNGLTIKNGPSVTEKGVDAGNKKVTNVADGDINETSKDAVNGSQLYQAVNNINKNVNAAKTELEEGDNVTITSRVGNNGQTIYKVSSSLKDNSAHVQGGSDAVSVTKAETTRKDGSTTMTDYTVDLSSKTKDDIKKGVDAHDTVTNKGLTFNADKGTTGAKKLGSQVAVNGDNKNIETVADTNGVKVKLKDDINVNSVTANTFKAGDTIVNTKGVQVAAKDDRGNNTNVVINEKGINAGNTRIQNVAAGRADTDAVNVSQLKGAVTQIGNHINKMDKNLRAGIAGAMAAGGLYHVTLPGKSMIAAGAGTYKGESAVAVGYSRLSDNGKVGIKFSVNTNTRGDSGAAASVGYQW